MIFSIYGERGQTFKTSSGVVQSRPVLEFSQASILNKIAGRLVHDDTRFKRLLIYVCVFNGTGNTMIVVFKIRRG